MKLEVPWHSAALNSANSTFILPLPAIPLPASLSSCLYGWWKKKKSAPEAPNNPNCQFHSVGQRHHTRREFNAFSDRPDNTFITWKNIEKLALSSPLNWTYTQWQSQTDTKPLPKSDSPIRCISSSVLFFFFFFSFPRLPGRWHTGVSVASNEDYALCLLPAGWGNNNSVSGFLSAARLSLCLRVPVNRV